MAPVGSSDVLISAVAPPSVAMGRPVSSRASTICPSRIPERFHGLPELDPDDEARRASRPEEAQDVRVDEPPLLGPSLAARLARPSRLGRDRRERGLGPRRRGSGVDRPGAGAAVTSGEADGMFGLT